ncbi:MFS transporter [Rhodoplanes sp. TEM]|uniref:MFS transporter n=1 Tax=Rhodoplanes tepidamans TaxID=200616 RepID=A0ABT5JBF4_RHOTP|nr:MULTISPECIES: MFS transporter [Rhodoplanes]MDC7786959.1 MFS transporter [Rhodoplanes tepidamans]MDC7985050.1 MFS transporter [Rhodoplanes sp. TEM]MDQ0355344.1 putative MFS family arabinose efflux permease [Rhodoplanes tepidamans]
MLSFAAFASQAQVRAADSVLPQIAADFAVTVGAASVVVSSYLLVHGSMQLVVGPLGDRVGKYRMITAAAALASLLVLACALATTLAGLTLVRLACGLTAACIIPLGMAYIGDTVPYERRQQVLGRYLSGQVMGQLFGQAAGGIVGDALGWRAVFLVLGGIFMLAALALATELRRNPLTRGQGGGGPAIGMIEGYRIVLRNRWARTLMLIVFVEGALMFGALAYVGADLHGRFGLSFTMVGVVIGTFGLGGLIYAASVKVLVGRLGQTGLAIAGGATLGVAYATLALAPSWWFAPIGVTLTGLGFYMLHNTLQTNATQMSPEARGTGVALFSASLFLGQPLGVALFAPVIDGWGAPPVFLAAAVLLPLVGLWFAAKLRQRASAV